MDFYKSINPYYDLIFPVDAQALAFLAGKTRPGSRILDIACGTGGYALALAELGHRVTGVDLNRAMIEAALDKGRSRHPTVDFQVLDMLKIGRVFEPGFDLIFCIGNSLVHLDTERKIRRLFASCRELLAPGGTCVIQIINFDRILAEGLGGLPTITDPAVGLEFRRAYDADADPGRVIFRTELSVGAGEKSERIVNRIPLRIVGKDRLLTLAREGGFRRFELNGDFHGRPYDRDSFLLILCAGLQPSTDTRSGL